MKTIVKSILRGAGQVMFQCSAYTGLFFLLGIFWGSYECHVPQVAWAAVVGLIASTFAGWLMGEPKTDGQEGLWGFNGILVGCGFATFMANTWLMWVAMIFCAMMSTWVRRALNNTMAAWKVNSFTFPFVFLTWVFLFATRMMTGLDGSGLSDPSLTVDLAGTLPMGFCDLLVYWLKGIAQVFLVNSWVTGVLFLIGLALCSPWAAIWAAIGSAVSLALAILFGAAPHDIANGLFGFSPVLTAIALATTFYKVNWKSALWALAGIAATFFLQAGMDALLTPFGLPTLTGPFCVATWLFLLPLYKLDVVKSPDHSNWHKTKPTANTSNK